MGNSDTSDSGTTEARRGRWSRLWRRLRGGTLPSDETGPSKLVAPPNLKLLDEDFRLALGPDELVSGPDEPVSGPDEPVSGPDEPVSGPDEPVSGPDELVSGRDEVIVGIDFGTSTSSVALLGDGGIEMVPIEGDVMMPSVVSFPSAEEIVLGAAARQRLAGNAQWTIVSPKRLLGRLYKDSSAQRLFSGLAFRTFAGSDRYLRFEAHGRVYSAQDICAEILKVLRVTASERLGVDVRSVVIAAPVGFGSLQRSALQQAARQAGLTIKAVLSEPTAAVLSQGFPQGWEGKVAIYDFGGGTFDFSVLDVSASSYRELCSGGDPWLGGDDFDRSLADELADAFERGTQVDLRSRAVEWQRVLFAAEKAKRDLTKHEATDVRVDDLIMTNDGARGLSSRIPRQVFDRLTAPLVERSITVVERVLHQAGILPSAVDAIVMTGGTSLVPAVQQAVRDFFGREPLVGEPHLAVVQGAAVHGAVLSGADIARAALRGRDVSTVVGRTIGAGVEGGPVETIFERDTAIPATKRHRFVTRDGDKTTLEIKLYEQSTSRIDESRPLGKVLLKGLLGLPAGEEHVDVTFSLGENGVLAVNASIDGRQYSEEVRTQAALRAARGQPLGVNHPAAGTPAGQEPTLPEVKSVPARATRSGQIDGK